jgi:hypothetical protein
MFLKTLQDLSWTESKMIDSITKALEVKELFGADLPLDEGSSFIGTIDEISLEWLSSKIKQSRFSGEIAMIIPSIVKEIDSVLFQNSLKRL